MQFESFELHFSADIKKSILERKISVCENWNDLIREPAWIHKHGFSRTFSYSESLRVSYNIFLHLNNQA